MKSIFCYLIFIALLLASCDFEKSNDLIQNSNLDSYKEVIIKPTVDTSSRIIKERFIVPEGFKRDNYASTSFANHLQTLPLKPENAKVLYYNGSEKANHNTYSAVIDLPIGKRNLHQCADAVIRLRADYLRSQERYEDIHFNFTNGMKVDYSNWRKGRRIKVDGNKTSWVNSASPSDSDQSYWKYLEIVFAYAGTLSLEKELQQVHIDDLEIGDVFIQGGSPGHAIIVVDKASNEDGEIIFILAQSYMPAQELQILVNPNIKNISPWYEIPNDKFLRTPEWTFSTSNLKRF